METPREIQRDEFPHDFNANKQTTFRIGHIVVVITCPRPVEIQASFTSVRMPISLSPATAVALSR